MDFLIVLLTTVGAQKAVTMNGFGDQQPDFVPFTTIHGGRDWSSICATGHFQSPIDINQHPANPSQYQVVSATNSSFAPLYARTTSVSMNSLQLMDIFDFTAWLVYASDLQEVADLYRITHTLGDIRVLAPAEHTLNGVKYPLAIQLVYVLRQPDANYFPSLFVQLHFQEGRLSPLIEALRTGQGTVDISELYPSGGVVDDYFTYTGSGNVPTPSYREPYTWVIPNYVLQASAEQISYWRSLYDSDTGNARDLQPLRDRIVYHFVPDSSRSFLQPSIE